jgi:hypothetical protein
MGARRLRNRDFERRHAAQHDRRRDVSARVPAAPTGLRVARPDGRLRASWDQGRQMGSVEPHSRATLPSALAAGRLAMLRWFLRLLIGLFIFALISVIAGPWLLYVIGLAKIDGRPSHAAVAPEDVEALLRTLRISQPLTIDRVSPHSYVWAVVRRDERALGQGVRLAGPIANSHNADHLADRSMGAWHLSGAALTIWLIRHWTTDELIAKAIELEKAAAKAKEAPAR